MCILGAVIPELWRIVSLLTERFVALDVHDVRFPTSDDLDGSDAMNPNPDYSAAYAVLRTDAEDGLGGHALAFTTGPGNDSQIRAIEGLSDWVVGRSVDEVLGDLGAFSKELIHEPHLRWLGPEKGVVHMAAGAVITLVPVIVVFIFLQRYFVLGLTEGATKG